MNVDSVAEWLKSRGRQRFTDLFEQKQSI